ncbi:MAG: DUF1194 domain-containing protein [Bdellovibrionales bacterium]
MSFKKLIPLSLIFLTPFVGEASTCSGARPDLSLVLAIDVSGSVDKKEMETQLKGYRDAFLSPMVQQNLLGCQCTEISVILWAEKAAVAYPATKMSGPEEVSKLSNFFDNLSKNPSPSVTYGLSETTELTNMLEASGKYLLDLPSRAIRLAINVSGDGTIPNFASASLSRLRARKDFLINNDITVNGIPIVVYEGSDFVPVQNAGGILSPLSQRSTQAPLYSDVAEFFDKEVRTPYGFLQRAEGYDDFPLAVQKSLERTTCNLMM